MICIDCSVEISTDKALLEHFHQGHTITTNHRRSLEVDEKDWINGEYRLTLEGARGKHRFQVTREEGTNLLSLWKDAKLENFEQPFLEILENEVLGAMGQGVA